jgi:putative transposase
VPSGLHRYQQTRDLHFLTFSCYRRQTKLGTPSARSRFELSLEQIRQRYRLCVLGYVVMPEHVHLLLSEPEATPLSTALQALKQSVSRTLALCQAAPFWQARYYDFNVFTEAKRIEKLHYMHRDTPSRAASSRNQKIGDGRASATMQPALRGP